MGKTASFGMIQTPGIQQLIFLDKLLAKMFIFRRPTSGKSVCFWILIELKMLKSKVFSLVHSYIRLISKLLLYHNSGKLLCCSDYKQFSLMFSPLCSSLWRDLTMWWSVFIMMTITASSLSLIGQRHTMLSSDWLPISQCSAKSHSHLSSVTLHHTVMVNHHKL